MYRYCMQLARQSSPAFSKINFTFPCVSNHKCPFGHWMVLIVFLWWQDIVQKYHNGWLNVGVSYMVSSVIKMQMCHFSSYIYVPHYDILFCHTLNTKKSCISSLYGNFEELNKKLVCGRGGVAHVNGHVLTVNICCRKIREVLNITEKVGKHCER